VLPWDCRDDLVSPDLADRLVSACRTVVGDRTRSVTFFTPDAFAQVYLRSDLDADVDLAGFASARSAASGPTPPPAARNSATTTTRSARSRTATSRA
jgi:hypothetical protein